VKKVAMKNIWLDDLPPLNKIKQLAGLKIYDLYYSDDGLHNFNKENAGSFIFEVSDEDATMLILSGLVEPASVYQNYTLVGEDSGIFDFELDLFGLAELIYTDI
jgi:hypothetical protein